MGYAHGEHFRGACLVRWGSQGGKWVLAGRLHATRHRTLTHHRTHRVAVFLPLVWRGRRVDHWGPYTECGSARQQWKNHDREWLATKTKEKRERNETKKNVAPTRDIKKKKKRIDMEKHTGVCVHPRPLTQCGCHPHASRSAGPAQTPRKHGRPCPPTEAPGALPLPHRPWRTGDHCRRSTASRGGAAAAAGGAAEEQVAASAATRRHVPLPRLHAPQPRASLQGCLASQWLPPPPGGLFCRKPQAGGARSRLPHARQVARWACRPGRLPRPRRKPPPSRPAPWKQAPQTARVGRCPFCQRAPWPDEQCPHCSLDQWTG